MFNDKHTKPISYVCIYTDVSFIESRARVDGWIKKRHQWDISTVENKMKPIFFLSFIAFYLFCVSRVTFKKRVLISFIQIQIFFIYMSVTLLKGFCHRKFNFNLTLNVITCIKRYIVVSDQIYQLMHWSQTWHALYSLNG